VEQMLRLMAVIGVAIFMSEAAVHAQQPKKIPRIGYLSSLDPAHESARAEGIRLALRELGYVAGENIAIDYRYSGGKDRSGVRACG
jgi:putative ABC transport system substrate-binding protein